MTRAAAESCRRRSPSPRKGGAGLAAALDYAWTFSRALSAGEVARVHTQAGCAPRCDGVAGKYTLRASAGDTLRGALENDAGADAYVREGA